jgi:hypothetical protein
LFEYNSSGKIGGFLTEHDQKMAFMQCPKCGNLCSFPKIDLGREGICAACSEHFVISTESSRKPKIIKVLGGPVEGFYQSITIGNLKALVAPTSVTSVVWLAAITALRFFIGHTDYSFNVPGLRIQLPTGQIATVITIGVSFWYFMETIRWAIFDENDLPEVVMSFGFGLAWDVIKSIWLFLSALVIALLPFIYIANMLPEELRQSPLFHLIILPGLFIFPMTLLLISAGKKLWMAIRPDYIIRPIMKAPLQYVTIVILFGVSYLCHILTLGYGSLKDPTYLSIALHLFADIASIFLTLLAMRSIGLFCKHYNCYMPWLD